MKPFSYWAESSHYRIWQQALSVLATRREEAGLKVWLDMQRYPATLLLYALGLGAVASGKIEFLANLLTTQIPSRTDKDRQALQVLPPFCLFDNIEFLKLLHGVGNAYAPLNVWIYETLKPLARRVIHSDIDYARVFDKLEVLIALAYRHRIEPASVANWVPLGRFGYEHENRERVLQEINDSFSKYGDDSPYIKCALFGSTKEQAKQVLVAFGEFMKEVGKRWW